jgi:hypothetical protein
VKRYDEAFGMPLHILVEREILDRKHVASNRPEFFDLRLHGIDVLRTCVLDQVQGKGLNQDG